MNYLVNFQPVQLAFSGQFSTGVNKYNSIAVDALQLTGLAGIGDALGIIAGAIAFRVAFSSASKLGVIPK